MNRLWNIPPHQRIADQYWRHAGQGSRCKSRHVATHSFRTEPGIKKSKVAIEAEEVQRFVWDNAHEIDGVSSPEAL